MRRFVHEFSTHFDSNFDLCGVEISAYRAVMNLQWNPSIGLTLVRPNFEMGKAYLGLNRVLTKISSSCPVQITAQPSPVQGKVESAVGFTPRHRVSAVQVDFVFAVL